jgi:hypothetical protein
MVLMRMLSWTTRCYLPDAPTENMGFGFDEFSRHVLVSMLFRMLLTTSSVSLI